MSGSEVGGEREKMGATQLQLRSSHHPLKRGAPQTGSKLPRPNVHSSPLSTHFQSSKPQANLEATLDHAAHAILEAWHRCPWSVLPNFPAPRFELIHSGSSVDRETEAEGSLLPSSPQNAHLSLDAQRQRLPIYKHREKLLWCVERYRVIIVVGQTGCGKSTRQSSGPILHLSKVIEVVRH